MEGHIPPMAVIAGRHFSRLSDVDNRLSRYYSLVILTVRCVLPVN